MKWGIFIFMSLCGAGSGKTIRELKKEKENSSIKNKVKQI